MQKSLLLLVPLLALACGPVPSLYIHHMKAGKRAERRDGEKLKLQRQNPDQYGKGQPGYFVLKSEQEWNQYWAGNGSPNAKSPDIDYSHKMVLMAATETPGVQSLKVTSVVEDGTAMYIYVAATRAGSSCPTRTEGTLKQDLVIVDRTDKPIHFYEETDNASSCGDAPLASIACTVGGKPVSGAELTANAGELVECAANVQMRGVFAQADSHWSWLEHPANSGAKLAFDNTGMKVKFTTDVFGRYGVKFEVRDDAGRPGEATTLVKVGPQKDGLLVQMAWTSFDRNDDPSTFPRVSLEATGPEQGKGTCSLDSSPKPGWCEISKQSQTLTTLRFAGAMEGAYAVSVKYTDDRFAGGPAVCVRTFLNGEQKQEMCDKDTRKAGSEWKLGAVIARTGAIEPLREDGATPDVAQPTGKPAGGKPAGGKPAGGKPAGGKPAGGKPAGGKPAGGKPSGGTKPSGGKPAFTP